jgi:antitoxin ParD1/3/4
MQVSLTPDLERIVSESLASGEYESAHDVVGEALRLLRERDEQRRQELETLRSAIRVGLEQLDRGEATVYDADSLKDLIEGIKARGRAGLSGRQIQKAP